MLQIKNLVKRYTTKGETVIALDHVSVDFPEKGMVFLLGKSGSGKSTLLNVSGGLDSPDEGEIIVKGKSSKDFSKSDFDSYRNTYLGFIFQEYNILNELTVAENLALALELQGKPREKALVDSLLEQVDLKGYGDRHPNTLSGGQKQRVAIARALIKSPEIIMADEPTGALDSATGAQVFDTLKKLSEEKLVVVVSHDREFAERYADRIIELKDGKIISDMTRSGEETFGDNLIEGEKSLTVACGTALSDEEAQKVVSFLKRHKGGVVISAQDETLLERKAVFSETKAEEQPREKDTSNFIRSKFPMRYAVKMGLSGLKFKPIRLVFTTLLATLAFIVFGVFSTVVTYSPNTICANTLNDSAFSAAVLLKKGYRHTTDARAVNQDDYFPVVASLKLHFDEHDIARLEEEHPEMNYIPVLDLGLSPFDLSQSQANPSDEGYVASNYYAQMRYLNGFITVDDFQTKTPFTLIQGEWPKAVSKETGEASEVVISKEVLDTFIQYGYRERYDAPVEEIGSFSDLKGKLITATTGAATIYLKVVGIVDTQEDFSAYEHLIAGNTTADENDALKELFRYSFASLGVVADSFYEENKTFDISPSNYQSTMREFDPNRRSPWETSPFWTTSYSEDAEGSILYSYLYSTLKEDRASRCSTLMSYNRTVDKERDIYYFTPYSFTADIAAGDKVLSEMTAIMGPAAGVLALFAALLLFNFISASINAKKKDIGILRAVGARGSDVFKIFIVEGLAITLVSFALGCLGSFAVCAVVNAVIIERNVLTFSAFLFGWLNALMVFAIALVTAVVATSIPVFLNVRKKPVEAIRAI